MKELEGNNWKRLFDSVERSIALTLMRPGDRLIDINLDALPNSISPRGCVALGLRAQPKTQIALYRKYLADYSSDDLRILEFCQNAAVLLLASGNGDWKHSLHIIELSFEKGVVSKPFPYRQLMSRTGAKGIPLEHAIHIVNNANRYPALLVAAAESKCREHVARNIVPVGDVAVKDQWFEN